MWQATQAQGSPGFLWLLVPALSLLSNVGLYVTWVRGYSRMMKAIGERDLQHRLLWADYKVRKDISENGGRAT